jgi:hypothetical protein
MGKRMFTVDFENGVIVNVLANDESHAVYIGKQKGGCGRPEVWESDSVAESLVNIEANDDGEMIAGFNSSFPIELKNKLSFFMGK